MLVLVGLYLILALEVTGRVRGAAVSTLCLLLLIGYVLVLLVPFARDFFSLALPGPAVLGPALGLAAGFLFAGGDISAKLAVYGGIWLLAVSSLIVCYALGTSVLQGAFQHGDALTGAGLATLATNAIPIAAGFVVFDEQLPDGTRGLLQLAAFASLVASAVLLARTPHPPTAEARGFWAPSVTLPSPNRAREQGRHDTDPGGDRQLAADGSDGGQADPVPLSRTGRRRAWLAERRRRPDDRPARADGFRDDRQALALGCGGSSPAGRVERPDRPAALRPGLGNRAGRGDASARSRLRCDAGRV